MGKLTKFNIRCLLYFNEQNMLSLSHPTPTSPPPPSLPSPPFPIPSHSVYFIPRDFKNVKRSWCNMLPDQQYRIIISIQLLNNKTFVTQSMLSLPPQLLSGSCEYCKHIIRRLSLDNIPQFRNPNRYGHQILHPRKYYGLC